MKKVLNNYICRVKSKLRNKTNELQKQYISLAGKAGEACWYRKFCKLHPKLDITHSDQSKLRLVLGLGRSGTTWIAKVLSSTKTPVRYFEEPLHHIVPSLSFSSGYNHTAIRFIRVLDDTHRLAFAYKLLTLPEYDWDRLGIQDHLKKDDVSFKFCLVKEVHSLLATEALVNKFHIPVIIVVRNPFYIADSLFHAQSLSSPYLINHIRLMVHDSVFLGHYFANREDKIRSIFNQISTWADGRRKTVCESILLLCMMKEMLEQVGKRSRFTHVVQYEELCLRPEKEFAQMAAFFGLAWSQTNQDALSATMSCKVPVTNPYSIKRNTKQQVNRPFRVLSQEEVEEARRLLEYCQVGTTDDICKSL